jgi:hypothetical protein
MTSEADCYYFSVVRMQDAIVLWSFYVLNSVFVYCMQLPATTVSMPMDDGQIMLQGAGTCRYLRPMKAHQQKSASQIPRLPSISMLV